MGRIVKESIVAYSHRMYELNKKYKLNKGGNTMSSEMENNCYTCRDKRLELWSKCAELEDLISLAKKGQLDHSEGGVNKAREILNKTRDFLDKPTKFKEDQQLVNARHTRDEIFRMVELGIISKIESRKLLGVESLIRD